METPLKMCFHNKKRTHRSKTNYFFVPLERVYMYIKNDTPYGKTPMHYYTTIPRTERVYSTN